MTILLRLISKFPFTCLYILSTLIYWVGFYIVRFKRKNVEHNIKLVFPEYSDEQRYQLMKKHYQHLADLVVENIKSISMPKETLLKRVQFENPELLYKKLDQKQPIMVVGLHQSNFEWLAQACGLKLNVPVEVIYKPVKHPVFKKLLFEVRSKFGTHLLHYKEAMETIGAWRGRTRVLAMVADQAPVEKAKKFWATCFGHKTAFYQGIGKIAELTQYPVYFVSIKRKLRGYYTVHFEKLLPEGVQQTYENIMLAYTACFERNVKSLPEEWLWVHQRWHLN